VTPKCAAIAGSGKPCKGLVRAGNDFCPAHDPSRAEARSKAAAKAGRTKWGGELAEVKAQLRTLADDVVAGTIDKGRGSVAAQIIGVFARVVEVERKVKEQDELIERLEDLEALLAEKKEQNRWGA
jgi:hypothetical protein